MHIGCQLGGKRLAIAPAPPVKISVVHFGDVNTPQTLLSTPTSKTTHTHRDSHTHMHKQVIWYSCTQIHLCLGHISTTCQETLERELRMDEEAVNFTGSISVHQSSKLTFWNALSPVHVNLQEYNKGAKEHPLGRNAITSTQR